MQPRNCLCVVALLLFAALLPGEEDTRASYPLQIGNRWTFQVRGQTEKFVQTAAREEKVGEQTCVVLESRFKDKVIATEHVAVLKDGVYRFKYQNLECKPAVCFWKLPAKKGDKWETETRISGQKLSAHWEVDTEDVKVPAGVYKGALVISSKMKINDKTTNTKNTIWFVPGVGMVKQVLSSDKGDLIIELEKFEKAGAKKDR